MSTPLPFVAARAGEYLRQRYSLPCSEKDTLAKLACVFTCQLLVGDPAKAITDNPETRRVEMSRNKPSSEQSGPTTRYGRQIAYDFEIAITICRRVLLGEDLQDVCAKPPMPIGPIFLGWVEDHPEARAIYRSMQNFQSDLALGKQLGVLPARATVGEWEEDIRANHERGWPADWIERKYTPPDWEKVYPKLGGPPVWSTEDIEAYTEILNAFTEMWEPRDLMELMWTKEAADAAWEAMRMAREKKSLPEHKYQERLRVLAQVQRQRGAAESITAKPATAFDHSLGLQAGYKYYQAFDIAHSRAIKRRDNVPRRIAHWRKGPGAKARRLPDKYVAEAALLERYDATGLLTDLEASAIAADPAKAALPLASAGEAADAAPPVSLAGEAAEDGPASNGETAEPVAPLRALDVVVDAAPPVALGGDATQDAHPTAPTGEGADAAPAPQGAAPDQAAKAAPSRAPAEDEPMNWVGWLKGAERYEWIVLSLGAQKEFNQSVTSKQWLVEKLVVDLKIIPPDEVCPELAHYLLASAQASPTVTPSAEAPQ